MPPDVDLFPEISGSGHRCTIRFRQWSSAASRQVHVDANVPFLLTCCA
jgi:cell division FtsZ-interacting protein ZapD